MNVLHVFFGLPTGGAQRAFSNLVSSGLSQAIENRIVCLRGDGTYGPYLRQLGLPVTSLRMAPGLPNLLRLQGVVRDFQPDIIQGWTYYGNLGASLVAKLTKSKTPVAWNIRHSLSKLSYEKWTTQMVIRGNRLLSGKPAALIYNSALSRKQHEAFGFPATQGQVIPNGFDPERWRPDSQVKSAVRRELGIDEASLIIGHVARFHPQKDHQGYLQALKDVAGTNPKVHFVLVGTHVQPDNPLLAPLIAELPRDRVHLLGEHAHVEQLMPAFDVLCLSSAWGEAFPNVLGEAMACGVPCVTTDVGDARYIVADTGYIVQPWDPKALAEALQRMVNMPAEDRNRLGQAARYRIMEHFSLRHVSERYRQLYASLL